VTRAVFRDQIMPAGQPAVLKGLVADWPAVKAARASDEAMADYLLGFDAGKPVTILTGGPEIGGRFFYTDAMDGLNFRRQQTALAEALKGLLAFRPDDRAAGPGRAVGRRPSALPGFARPIRCRCWTIPRRASGSATPSPPPPTST
jgi:hypothetical protein